MIDYFLQQTPKFFLLEISIYRYDAYFIFFLQTDQDYLFLLDIDNC